MWTLRPDRLRLGALGLLALGLAVKRVLHQGLQRGQRLPVVDVGDQALGGVVPALLTEVAGQAPRHRGDGLVKAVELVVPLALGEDEGGGVHGAPQAWPGQRLKVW